jgi:hypothetical protein
VTEPSKNILDRFKPAVGRRTLLFVGGFVWVCVGIMLLTFSCQWLGAFHASSILPYVAAGIALALVVHHFGFLKIVDKNLGRLLTAEEKKCVFYFMPWRSYLTVAVMVTLGVGLRHSPIPKQYLAILYVGIGLGLILSSVRYFRVLLRQGWK